MFKSFVIILNGHTLSEDVGNDCIQSGLQYGWNIQKFDAVDGRDLNLKKLKKNYGLKVNKNSKKQFEAIQRPGVLGNFVSHWKLWNTCVELNEPIGCFEHDVIFQKTPNIIDFNFNDLLKLDRLKLQKNYGTGNCWQGAHAYIIKPSGARKLLAWANNWGVVGADVMIGDAVLNIDFNNDNLIGFNSKTHDQKGRALKSLSKTEDF